MSTHVAALIIQEEPRTLGVPDPQRWWTLSLVVGGTFHRIGERVPAYNEQEAAHVFAQALSLPTSDQ